ncbi:MAG: glycosyltransferase family A protein [Chitinophagaceae bacterium]
MQETQLTVVMPAYNASRYIYQTLEAIVAQTFPAWQLVVVNDCSNDDTASTVEGWSGRDDRIQLVNNQQNLKVAKSMNKGIALVDTKYFARIDSDDVPLPTHFEKLVAFLEAHPDIDICGSQVLTIDSQGAFRRKWNYETDSDWIKMSAIFACPFLQSSVVMNTNVIKELGGYSPEMELVEDYELWIRALTRYKAANIPDYTMQYRIHDSNMSETNKLKIMSMLEGLFLSYQQYYPIAEQHLGLHARMEFGDWSGMSVSDNRALGKWRNALESLNEKQRFYPKERYSEVLSKYFTNAYLKIATQNSGAVHFCALAKAFRTSPRYFKEIWKRKRENLISPNNA